MSLAFSVNCSLLTFSEFNSSSILITHLIYAHCERLVFSGQFTMCRTGPQKVRVIMWVKILVCKVCVYSKCW